MPHPGAGKPTLVIPFFGDQHFWGAAVHRNGLGPEAIPVDALTVEGLTAALRFMQRPEVAAAAAAAADKIGCEDGVAAAVAAFHRRLPLEAMAAGQRVEWDLSAPQVYGGVGGLGGPAVLAASVQSPRRLLHCRHQPSPRSFPPSQVSNFWYETSASLVNLVAMPVKGAKRDGVAGALLGAGRGLAEMPMRHAKGVALTATALGRAVASTRVRVDQPPGASTSHSLQGGGGGE